MTSSIYLVVGPPGCGKTNYIKEQLPRAIEKYGAANVRACSYTRAAASELARRLDLPRHCVGTLHSFCYRALNQPELASKHLKDFSQAFKHFKVSSSTANPDDPYSDEPGNTDGDKKIAEIEILRAGMVPVTQWPQKLIPFWMAYTSWKEENNYLDFTDMLEIVLRDFDTMPGDPAVLALDEAQDCSRLQFALVLKWAKHTQRTIIAGDVAQTIYEWCGASADEFMNLHDGLPPEQRRYLKQSFRVPALIHAHAEDWISRLSRTSERPYSPKADQGEVMRSSATYKAPDRLLDLIAEEESAGRTVMILGSCRFIIERTMGMLRKNGIPFHNPYRTKDGGFNPLLSGGSKKTMPVDRVRAFLRVLGGEKKWTDHDIYLWMSCLEAKGFLRHGAKKTVESFKGGSDHADYGMLLDEIIEPNANLDPIWQMESGGNMKEATSWWLEHCLPKFARKLEYPCRVAVSRGVAAMDEEPKVITGTGHSVKGGEADCVVIFPDISKSGMIEWTGSARRRDPIRRLFYVMMTRAKQKLIICDPSTNYHVRIRR